MGKKIRQRTIEDLRIVTIYAILSSCLLNGALLLNGHETVWLSTFIVCGAIGLLAMIISGYKHYSELKDDMDKGHPILGE